MAIEYLGLDEINGPLVVLEGVKNAAYEEIVEFSVEGKEKKLGRIVVIYEDKAVIQVFENLPCFGLKHFAFDSYDIADIQFLEIFI